MRDDVPLVELPPDAGPGPGALHDEESRAWLEALTGARARQEAAVADLHALLLRVASAEVRRRGPGTGLRGPESEDVAHQAADDATVAVLAKLASFRGESRFTTWAYRFAVLEVSAKLGRHWWARRDRTTVLDAEEWERLPDRLDVDPAAHAERQEVVAAVRAAVDAELSDRQRRVFVAIVLQGVPVDALAADLGTTRNTLYKTVFDARRKIRAHLVASGHLVGGREGPVLP